MTIHHQTPLNFTENGPVDIDQFNALHRLIGWDPKRQQTPEKTAEMLRLNHYHIAAHTETGELVGFARVCGDPYIAQVLDVITHPAYRRRGIATRCMQGVVAYLQQADYVSVTLTDGSQLPHFYAKFGFQLLKDDTPTRIWRPNSVQFSPASSPPTRRASSSGPTQPKVIGVLGGISHESTIHYYDRILKKYHALRQDYYYPRIIIHSLDFQTFTDYEDRGERINYINEIMSGIESLERGGAEFILMAANSPHSVYHDIARRTLLPMISIVDETIHHAQQQSLQSLLLLGIKYTMQSNFYQLAGEEVGISIITPSEAEQDLINQIIFRELVLGIFKPESRALLLEIIARYPVDGVILGCTELPLILTQADLPIPGLDTLDLHAEAALWYSLGE